MKTFCCLFATVCCLASNLPGQIWPTYRNDFGRSGFVQADFDPGMLQPLWNWKSPVPPEPAWDGPARWDAFAALKDLPAMRQYDACFHPVSDGKLVLFGSSSQDALFAIDLESGKPQWTLVTDGPIRIAPTIIDEKVLIGSDDGFVYCLEKKSGNLVWKFNPARHAQAELRQVLNNDRLISFYPIRTGIVVRDEIAYFAASFLPWRESYICAVNVNTGKLDKPGTTFVSRHENATLEGPLLVANDRLIVPQGRIAPLMFDRKTGDNLGSLPGGGGVTIVLTEKGDVARTEGGRASRPGSIGVFRGKERVASFPRGRSIVVQKSAFYVIDQNKVFAASRNANELLWQRELSEPLELIMVGNSLVVGGRDSIAILDSKNGKIEWQHKLNGRVFGLAYAGGKLIASTDTGQIHCFDATRKSRWTPPTQSEESVRELVPEPKIAAEEQDNLLHRWVFHRSAMRRSNGADVKSDKLNDLDVRDLSGETPLPLAGNALSIPLTDNAPVEAAELNNSYFPIEERFAQSLPAKDITLESWVRVDSPTTWGGIVGCIQDDGSTEHGWLLGFNGSQFSLAIAGSKSGLTYLKSPENFRNGMWYHVAGTYDGSEMRLFVNGVQVATSKQETGPISYPKKRYFTVGAYRDANESFPLKGGLHEVRIYGKALLPEQIANNYELRKDFFPEPQRESVQSDNFLAWGPFVRFIGPGKVEISFGTKQPSKCDTEILQGKKTIGKSQSGELKKDHLFVIPGLPHRRMLEYVIRRKTTTPPAEETLNFSLDTHFDWTIPVSDKLASLPFLDQVANPRGTAFLVGKEHAALAEQIASSTSLTVILIEEDQAAATELKKKWLANHQTPYGKRLTVSTAPLEELPAAFASLVIASANRASTNSIKRLVRPGGGIVSDGKSIVWTRKPLDGAGEWTHMYGQADNSAYGGEHLGGASNREDLVANWIGRPGPRYQTDRQNRKPSPLAANGRLYLQGQQRLLALDSFSGNILWSVETPSVMRWNMPRDSSNWCADQKGVYVAAESEAWFIDGPTGQLKKRIQIPSSALRVFSDKEKAHWGYLARHEDLLLGTAVKSDAIYTKWWGKSQWFDSTNGNDTHIVTGDSLFGMHHQTGKLKWQYDGLVLHPTITVLGKHIYFVEDTTTEHVSNQSRRISIDKDQALRLVCLNLEDGTSVFTKELPSFQGKVSVLYLAAGGPPEKQSLVMVASEASKGEFAVTCLSPNDGNKRWNKSIKWEANHHGKHISRPAIENDLLYIRPEVISMADGSTIKRGFPGGHGCSSYTLSKNGLFSRLGETTWWDVRNDKVNRFSRVRTDCWISAIPAQGMLLSAEGGGGCSCGSWLETSIGFLPRKFDQFVPDESSDKN